MWSIVIPTLLKNKILLNKLLDEIIIIANYIDIEILLIVDVAAKEINYKILKKYERFLKVIYSDKNGPGLLRNIGLKHSVGEYISFFDDDDELIFLNSVIKFETDIVIFEFIHPSNVFNNEIILNLVKSDFLNNTKKICFKACELEFIFSYCQPFAIRRNILILNNIEFCNSYVMEDLDFISQIFSGDYTVSTFDKIKYKYISHPNSTKSLAGISLYYSSCIIADRIKSRINYSTCVDYTKMIYEYAKNIRRFRFIEASDYSLSNFHDYSFLINLIKNVKNLNSILIIYCYNNTSIKLLEILENINSFILDDNPINLQNNIKVLLTDDFLNILEPDVNLQIFISHAHPQVRNKILHLFENNLRKVTILN
jgi:glycosyltransferase involved in cell wall biosynthesis